MQRLDPCPEVSGSNQRSVIAKSVSNQVISVDATLSPEMYEPVENLKPGEVNLSYPSLEPSTPTRGQALFMSPTSSPPHPSVLANSNYSN